MDADSTTRERALLVLVLRYLRDADYQEAYDALCTESRLSLEQVDAASDITLPEVIRAYEDLFRAKHGKQPSLLENTFPYQPRNEAQSLWEPEMDGHDGTGGAHGPRSEMSGAGSKQGAVTGTTRFIGTTDSVLQRDFFRVLCEHASEDPCDVFRIAMPLACARRFRPSQLQLTPVQEHVLYGLVGCSDVMWRVSGVDQQSREILEQQYGITKRTLQLFFKNRYPNKKGKKRKFIESRRSLAELEEYRNHEGFVPIMPGPSSTQHMQVNSLYTMMRDLDGGGFPVSPSLISQHSYDHGERKSPRNVKSDDEASSD